MLVTCSATKRRLPEAAVAAIDRYDGVFFKVIRKAIADGRMKSRITIAIISAEFGLITSETPIPFYDRKLDKVQVASLRPKVDKALRQLLLKRRFRHIFVNIGQQYASLVEDVPELQVATWAQGPIGKRAAILKSWISST